MTSLTSLINHLLCTDQDALSHKHCGACTGVRQGCALEWISLEKIQETTMHVANDRWLNGDRSCWGRFQGETGSAGGKDVK